jgi:hypothetical protein
VWALDRVPGIAAPCTRMSADDQRRALPVCSGGRLAVGFVT